MAFWAGAKGLCHCVCYFWGPGPVILAKVAAAAVLSHLEALERLQMRRVLIAILGYLSASTPPNYGEKCPKTSKERPCIP